MSHDGGTTLPGRLRSAVLNILGGLFIGVFVLLSVLAVVFGSGLGWVRNHVQRLWRKES